MELIDAETGIHVKIALDDEARAAYREGFDDHAAQIRKLALRNGGRYVGLPVSVPIEDAIFGPLVNARSVQ
jgi:hypothetical protein